MAIDCFECGVCAATISPTARLAALFPPDSLARGERPVSNRFNAPQTGAVDQRSLQIERLQPNAPLF